MLRAYVINYSGNWVENLPLVEFAYNNSYHSSICMAPFEALYSRRCRFPVSLFELGEADIFGLDLVYQAMEKVNVIWDMLKASQSCQNSYADVR